MLKHLRGNRPIGSISLRIILMIGSTQQSEITEKQQNQNFTMLEQT